MNYRKKLYLSVMNLKESLLKEREILLERLQYIDEMLLKLGQESNPLYQAYEAISSKKGFPISGRKNQKVLWLFGNVFKTGRRFTSIQDTFNKYNGLDPDGKEIGLEGTVRGLKTSGKLVIVKYNKSNKLSFWGLTDWVNDDGFKPEFEPKELLSHNIESVEVIR